MKAMATNTDKHRYTYSSGIKAVETEKWGRNKAYSRYGVPEYLDGAPRPPDNSRLGRRSRRQRYCRFLVELEQGDERGLSPVTFELDQSPPFELAQCAPLGPAADAGVG